MKEAQYTPSHIANYFLYVARKENIDMSPLKLMKLVYFAYAWYLHLTEGEELFSEEIQAWKHGPVMPSLYHEFKHFGLHGKIDTFSSDIDESDGKATCPVIRPNETNEKAMEAVAGVWFLYKKESDKKLEKITHEKDAPWDTLYKEGKNIPMNDTETHRQLIKDRAKIGYEKAVKLWK